MAAPALSPVERNLLDPTWLAISLPCASRLERDTRSLWQAASLARLCLRAGWPAQAQAALCALALLDAPGPVLRERIRATLRELHGAIAVADAVGPVELA